MDATSDQTPQCLGRFCETSKPEQRSVLNKAHSRDGTSIYAECSVLIKVFYCQCLPAFLNKRLNHNYSNLIMDADCSFFGSYICLHAHACTQKCPHIVIARCLALKSCLQHLQLKAKIKKHTQSVATLTTRPVLGSVFVGPATFFAHSHLAAFNQSRCCGLAMAGSQTR